MLLIKSLQELGDKVSSEDKTAIEVAISDLKDVIKSDDKPAIEAKTQTLTELSGKIAQQAYAAEEGAAPDGFTDAAKAANEKPKEDDADYTEVKDDKKS